MRWNILGKHSIIMNSNLLLSLKGSVFSQCVLPVLTYRAESWRLTKDFERKLRSAQRGIEGEILDITWKDRKRDS